MGERRLTGRLCQNSAALGQRTRRQDLALNGEDGGKNAGGKLEQDAGNGTAQRLGCLGHLLVGLGMQKKRHC